MKLVLVTQYFPPEFEGGTECVVRAQAAALAARGHDVLVVSGSDRSREEGEAEIVESSVDGTAVARIPRLPSEVYDLRLERRRVTRVVLGACRGADLVHVHHWATLSGELVRALSTEHPVVLTLHDLFATCPRFFRRPPDPALRCPEPGDVEPCVACLAPDAPGRDEAALCGDLERRALGFEAEVRLARRVLAPSRTHAERLGALLEGVRPVVHPHGLCLDLESGGLEPGGRRDFDGTAPLSVLHFGHPSREKGTLELIRSLTCLEPGSVELAVAGALIPKELERELVEAAGRLAIEVAGPYDGERLAGLARRADLAAFPSRLEESYGLVVDEARALGLPVWVSDRGALGERLDGGGRILPAEDPAAWTEAFREVLSDPSRLATERRAVTVPLSAADACEELERIYAAVLAEDEPVAS